MAFLGIDIGGTFTKLALVDRAGRILARSKVATGEDRVPEMLFADIKQELPAFMGRRTFTAVGIGCAGLIDTKSGRVLESPNLPTWRNAPIRRIAQRVLGVKAFIDNDANAAAYGEYRIGHGRGSHMFVLLTLGTGVGGGIISDGRVLRGASNFAGEIGHMAVTQKGPKCRCGNRGCLEAYLGSYALVRDAHRRLRRRGSRLLRRHLDAGGRLTPKVLGQAARAGDAVANAVFAEAATHLGVALASLINVLNPDAIAIGGGVAAEYGLLRDGVRRVVRERAFDPSRKVVRIARAKLRNDAATVGAALMAQEMSRRP